MMRVQLNIQNLVVEHDASLVVSFVNSTAVANGGFATPIDDCGCC